MHTLSAVAACVLSMSAVAGCESRKLGVAGATCGASSDCAGSLQCVASTCVDSTAAAAAPKATPAAAPPATAQAAQPDVLGGRNIASRTRVQAINRMNEGIQLFDKNNVAGSERALQDAIQLDPTYAAAHHTLGQIFKKQNKLSEAVAAFRGAIANMGSEPSGEYYYDLGAALTGLGEASAGASEREASYHEAIVALQEALKIDPELYKAYYRIGTLHEKLGAYDEATAAYRKTTEVKQSYSPAYVSLGNLYIDRGDPTAGMAALNKGVEINGQDARMWNGLGRAHFTLGHMKEAVDAYTRAKAIDPDSVDALYGLGMSYAELRQPQEAREFLGLFLTKAGADTRPDLLQAALDTIARMGSP